MDPTRVTLVPHTHWDREWYDPFSVFSQRLLQMMDALLDLADEGFPHFHLDGQTAMIDDYLAMRPDRIEDVQRLVREGKLSAGPWFTQMDEFLTSGESHVRNLERGLARARSLGRALEIGYMPDQFGHVGQMPQILRLGGVEHAVVWRGVPAEIDRDAFWWESPDGSRVLTGYMAFGYSNGASLEGASGAEELAEALRSAVERQRPFMASDRMLVMVGYDHAGPDPSLVERIRHWSSGSPVRKPDWRGSAPPSAASGIIWRHSASRPICRRGGASSVPPRGRTSYRTSARPGSIRSASEGVSSRLTSASPRRAPRARASSVAPWTCSGVTSRRRA